MLSYHFASWLTSAPTKRTIKKNMALGAMFRFVALFVLVLLSGSEAQIALSTSAFQTCITTTATFSNFSCSTSQTVTSLIIATPLNAGPGNAAFQFDISNSAHPLEVESTTVQINILTDLVWKYALEQQPGLYPYDYAFIDRVSGASPPDPCPRGTMVATGAECPTGTGCCAATCSEIDALYPPKESAPERGRDAYFAARNLTAGGPRLGYWCGGGPLCEAGFHVDQLFWISPFYAYSKASNPAIAFYRIQAIITKASDPSNPETVQATSIKPTGSSANNLVLLHIITLLDPVGGSAPPFVGGFFVPVDSPYNNEGSIGPPLDEFANPRAFSVYPSYTLPKYFYDDRDTDDYGSGCCQNGIRQDYSGFAGQIGNMPDVCAGVGLNKCVNQDTCGGIVPKGKIKDRLNVRYNNWIADPAPLPAHMPPGWLSSTPNQWLYKTNFYTKPTDPNTKMVEIQILVSGDFVQQIVSISQGVFLPFGSSPCLTTEGTNSGFVTFKVRNTGAGFGAFRVEMVCSGGAVAVDPAVSNFQLAAGQNVTQQLAVGADLNTGNTEGSCTLTLFSVAVLITQQQDTATTTCKISSQNTLAPPATGSTGPPGSGGSACTAAKFFSDKITDCLPFLSFLGAFKKYFAYAVIICCCCCCCCICLLLLVFLLPMLTKGGGGGMGAEMSLLGFEVPRLISHDLPQTLQNTLPAALNAYFMDAGALARRHFDSAAVLVDHAVFGAEQEVARPREAGTAVVAPLDWRALDVAGPTRRRGGG
jgi:hypothetical protein